VKKLVLMVLSFLIAFTLYIPRTKAMETTDPNFCSQFVGLTKIWWNGVELKKGQIGRLTILKDTPLYKVSGETKTFSRTLKKGEFYRIYAFKPGMLSVGGGYYVTRDAKVSYETPSKTKLAAVACINPTMDQLAGRIRNATGAEVRVEGGAMAVLIGNKIIGTYSGETSTQKGIALTGAHNNPEVAGIMVSIITGVNKDAATKAIENILSGKEDSVTIGHINLNYDNGTFIWIRL